MKYYSTNLEKWVVNNKTMKMVPAIYRGNINYYKVCDNGHFIENKYNKCYSIFYRLYAAEIQYKKIVEITEEEYLMGIME
jgi:hypothetical protein